MHKRILCAGIAAALLLTLVAGCGGQSLEDDHYWEGTSGTEGEYFDPGAALENSGEYTQVPAQILQRTLTLTQAQATALKDVAANIRVDYKNSEQYGIGQCLDAYKALAHTPASPSSVIVQNGSVDYDTLLQAVLKNNQNAGAAGYYTELSRKDIENAVKVITETVNYNLERNPYIDHNVLDTKLKNLKIRGFSDFSYAFYTYEDNTVALDMPLLEKTEKQGFGSIRDMICHEANHILQDAAVVRDDGLELNFGFCYQFTDLDINALYWLWLVEGAAQNSSLLQNDLAFDEGATYHSYVRAVNALIATHAFLQEDVYELQHITTQKDLEMLFTVMGCSTDAEKEELLQMMVAYQLYCDSLDLILSEPLCEKMGVTDTYAFGKTLRCSIGQSLAKLFYRNLAEALQEKTVTVENVFALLAMYETWLSNHVWYTSIEQANHMFPFYKNYGILQDALFDEMAAALNMTTQELYKCYIDYFHTTDFSDFRNSMLTDGQNAFYQRLYRESRDNQDYTVKEVRGVLPQ